MSRYKTLAALIGMAVPNHEKIMRTLTKGNFLPGHRLGFALITVVKNPITLTRPSGSKESVSSTVT